MKLNRGKCEVLHLARNNPMHLYSLGASQLESCKGPADKELIMSQQRALILSTQSIISLPRCKGAK